jgi:hypothetical protein
MKNLHITHPEDLTFDGKESVQNVIEVMRSAFNDYNQEENVISVKYDGAPAIVFGKDVTNGRFFVGTKSVFNKGIKKICYTNDCIDYYYSEKTNLRNILRLCLKYLPRVAGVYQADFIGQGDGNTTTFTPNTITYKFDNAPTENIIMAVHTCYVGSDFDDMIAVPQSSLTMWGLNVKWVDGTVSINEHFYFEEAFKYSMDAIVDKLECMNDDDFPVFKTKIAKTRLMTLINSYIRDGRILNAEDLSKETGIKFDVFELWELIANAKMVLLNRFVPSSNVECFVNNSPVNHEGIVVTNIEHVMMIKLIDRYEFSRANFNNKKFAMAA